jgi:N-acetylglucosamine-6-sulfatase
VRRRPGAFSKLARVGAAAVLALVVAVAAHGGATAGAAAKPNVILILTDDQTSYELDAMPQTAALLRAKGVTFSRFYDSYPLCCPSRATLLTGEYMHNHQVRGNLPAFGGQHRFASLGTEAKALPTWLKGAGYNTAHVGKYLNGYGDDGNPQVPAGWDEWYGQVSDFDAAETGGKLYYDYNLLEKGLIGTAALHHYDSAPADYQTTVLQSKALGAIDDLSAQPNPFYLEFAPSAPHYPFTPPPQYAGTMANAPLPPLLGLNEKNINDKPAFLRALSPHRLSATTLATLAASRRQRLEQLRGVDDAVAAMVSKLAADGRLANTYLIFTSDNGYFFGEHRIVAGKYLPYEPASHVPFVIAGPGLPGGATSHTLSANIDVAPTVAALAGASPPAGFDVDGRSLLPFATNPAARSNRPVLLEADVGPGQGTLPAPSGLVRHRPLMEKLGLAGKAGVTNLEQEPGGERSALNGDVAPAYRAIRTNRYLFVIYSTGASELYDMAKDPGQLNSLVGNRRYNKVRRKLLRRLIILSGCAGHSCNVSYGPDPKPKPKKRRKGSKKK